MRKLHLLVIGLMMSGVLFSQQLNVSSLYNLNKYEINPAVAGTEKGIPLAFSYRKAWVGLDGSPSMQRLSAHMQVARNMGVGARIFNSTQGPIRKTGMEASYAYHIPLNTKDSSRLSFGLSAFVYQYYMDKQKLIVEDPSDPAVLGDEKKVVPDAAFGVYYYAKNYYVGLSIYQLFQGKIRFDPDDIIENERARHYLFNMGYKFEISKNFKLEPSVLLKYLEGSVFQADVNVYATYLDMVSLGVSYRTNDAVVLQFGYSSPKLNIAYAYDIGLGDISTVSSGSHEVMVVYRFGNPIKIK